MLTCTRVYDFSASHRLHGGSLTDSENTALFGKCNHPSGHGHNYLLEVTVTGPYDPLTGKSVPIDELDRLVDQEILIPFDHRHLNLDVTEFQDMNPTSENLTMVIWHRLSSRLHAGAIIGVSLVRILVRETERNYFEYFG